MNRTMIFVAGVFSAPALLVVDSAVKGTALVMLASVAALLLRRDSAATRHLAWFLAIVAMLAVPVLSATLPQWRVLPEWANIPSQKFVPAVGPHSPARPADIPTEAAQNRMPDEVKFPAAVAHQPTAVLADLPPARATPEPSPVPATATRNWLSALPLVWAIGFCLLLLRLAAARWMLWSAERQGTVLWPPKPLSPETHDPLVTALDAARLQLGIRRPVTLLIHPDKAIPVVWGIRRCRLLLPTAARDWGEEQLRSVLLHELAHVKRRDTLAQLLTQIACALHWFNPLVWFAAWRLGVERERACDDLVLASGVRPSAYAGHLLDVVTGLSPVRWTQACGLAMARKSSLEGRLVAVLSENLNRRSVTAALGAVALLLAAGIAIPLAMLRAADEKWEPPHAAHIGSNDFSVYCVHDGQDASFVLAYRGNFGSSSDHVSNSKTHTWTDAGTLTAKKPGISFSFHRVHTAPDKLTLTVAPAGGRDLSKPAPPPREYGQREYDLANGRVFLLNDDGFVRQLDIATPVVKDQEAAKKLAALIAAIPPQERAPASQEESKKPQDSAKLKPGLEEKLQWGKPVNGLRAALVRPQALGEPAAEEIFDFKIVVQNVSEKPVRLSTAAPAPESRYLNLRKDGATLLAFHDSKPAPVELMLAPRDVAVLRLFSGPEKGSTVTADDPAMTYSVELKFENAPAGAWTGTLVTADTVGLFSAYGLMPKHKDAQALFNIWTAIARGDGKIPGALIGQLGESVTTFTKYNPTWPTTPQLSKLLPRFDATHDWSSGDAIALLDELAAVQATPLSMALDHEQERTVRRGSPLPQQLANAPWGEALPNGLRLAWLLEPRAAEHRLNTPLKSRLLIHNAGKKPVVFRTRTWHQVGHTARDARGAEIKEESTEWTTIGRLTPFRLAPGEFIELNAPGIGVGANKDADDWQNTRVGTWIDAKAGDDVTVTTNPVPLSDWNEEAGPGAEPRWWLEFITARLARHEPFPADARDRERLLYRVAIELFGNPVNAEINAAFVADREPTARESLAKRLAKYDFVTPFVGSLASAPTRFKIIPADPNAAKRPRTASNPGQYNLAENAVLAVTRRPVGERIANEAHLRFYSPDPAKPAPGEPYDLKLPDGYDTWAAAWIRGGKVLWISQKGLLRKIAFTNPAKVEETRYEGDKTANAPIPPDIREALKAALTVPDAPKQVPETLRPAAPAPATPRPAAPANQKQEPKKPPEGAAAKLPDDALWKTKVPFEKIPVTIRNWSAEKNGLRLGMRVTADEGWRPGGKVQVELWLHNPSAKNISFNANPGRPDVGLSVAARNAEGKDHWAESGNVSIIAIPLHCVLPAGYVAKVKDFSLSFDAPDNTEKAWFAPKFRDLKAGKYKLRCVWADAHPIVSGPDDWTGELTSVERDFTLAELGS